MSGRRRLRKPRTQAHSRQVSRTLGSWTLDGLPSQTVQSWRHIVLDVTSLLEC